MSRRHAEFSRPSQSVRRSAVIYTLILNCRMHGSEPQAYLKDVLERLPRMTNQEVSALIPSNWKDTQPAQGRLAA